MDGLGIGQIHLVEHFNGIGCHPSVKINGQPLSGGIDLNDSAHVTVEHPRSDRAVFFRPDHVVIISRLHDAVTLTEHPLSPEDLPFTGNFGVQCFLQKAVQIHGSGDSLSGRRQHLNLLRWDAHILGQARFTKFHHRRHSPLAVPAAEEEIVPLIAVHLGRFTQIHRMGIPNDGGLLCLTEDLSQKNCFHPLAADQIGKHITGTHGRQLVRITHQNQTGSRFQRTQQCGKQRQVHHGHLVHDHRVRLQRFFFVFQKCNLMGSLVPVHSQHAVNGLGIHPRQFTHPLGGPSCRRRQDDIQAHLPEQRHDAPHSCGFTGTGAAGQNQNPVRGSQAHGLPLLRCIGDSLLCLNFR